MTFTVTNHNTTVHIFSFNCQIKYIWESLRLVPVGFTPYLQLIQVRQLLDIGVVGRHKSGFLINLINLSAQLGGNQIDHGQLEKKNNKKIVITKIPEIGLGLLNGFHRIYNETYVSLKSLNLCPGPELIQPAWTDGDLDRQEMF